MSDGETEACQTQMGPIITKSAHGFYGSVYTNSTTITLNITITLNCYIRRHHYIRRHCYVTWHRYVTGHNHIGLNRYSRHHDYITRHSHVTYHREITPSDSTISFIIETIKNQPLQWPVIHWRGCCWVDFITNRKHAKYSMGEYYTI